MNNYNNSEYDFRVEETVPGVPALPRAGELAAGLARPAALAGHDPSSGALAMTGPPTPRALLVALRRRGRLAVLGGLVLAGVVAGTAWLLLPPARYTARASLLVASAQPKMIFKTEENKVDFPTYQKTQKMVVKSDRVLIAALADPEVTRSAGLMAKLKAVGDPVPWLEKRIQADYQGEVFQIAISGDDAQELAILVNAVARSYLEHAIRDEDEERTRRRESLEARYNRYQLELRQSREDLKKLTQKVGTKDRQTLQFAQQMAIERLSTVRRELIQVQSDLRRARAELEIVLAREKNGPAPAPAPAAVPEALIQRAVDEDVEVQQLRARLAEANAAVGRAGRLARRQDDPAVLAALKELEARKAALASRATAVRSMAAGRAGRGGAAVDVDVEDAGVRALRDRVGMLDELERVTQAIFDAQAAENREIGQDSLYIDDIQDRILHADTAAKRIGEELEVLRVELDAPKRVRSLEPAKEPRVNEERRLSTAGLAGLGTFGVFLLGVAFLEFRARRISSVDEVTRGLGLRVMGALPPVRGSRRRIARSGSRSDPYGENLLTESIDSIRTMILHSTGGRPLRAIMVTSASSGEGKTSLACHLATSLARSGMKTLLIDCDLRKPTIHRLFDLPATPGFSEFLRGEATAAEVIRPATGDGPDLVPAGRCDATTLRALARAATGAIFEAYLGSYDIIVLDTSPILPVTDGLLVGRHVDAAVYSILNDVSRFPWTLAALGRLESLQIRILGAVVTGARSQVHGPYYSDGYSNSTGLRTQD